jgi:hypothetical protein
MSNGTAAQFAHEGALGAAARAVDAARQELLARSRLPQEQHRGVGRRRGLDHLHHPSPRGAHADRFRPLLFRAAPQVADFAAQGARRHDAFECELQDVGISGLDEVFRGTGPDALHGRRDRAVSREHDRRDLRMALGHLAHQGQPPGPIHP